MDVVCACGWGCSLSRQCTSIYVTDHPPTNRPPTVVFNDGLGGVVSPAEFQTYKTVEDLFVLLSDAYLNNFQRVEVRRRPIFLKEG